VFGPTGISAAAIALPSSDIVLLRTFLGALSLVTILAITQRHKLQAPSRPREAAALLLSGAALGASWIFLFRAYQTIGVGVSSLLYYCGPIIVMALSPLIFGEKLTGGKIAGFIAVACGAFLIAAQGLGGNMPIAGIACGIAHKPKLIFLDEPTVAVDPQSRNSILEGIQKLNREGATVVYTSHYMEEVEQICTRIMIMDKGKAVAVGTKEELKAGIMMKEKIEVEQVKRERDVAIEQLHGHCPACAHYTPNHNEGPCQFCCFEIARGTNVEINDNWKWRGPKEE